jgi:hypothetical protein
MQNVLASKSVARHLGRGALGFGLIGAAICLTTSVGPAALLLTPLGLFALRGCPTCWILGLVQTVSAGQLERNCTGTDCTLQHKQLTTDNSCPQPPSANSGQRPGTPFNS